MADLLDLPGVGLHPAQRGIERHVEADPLAQQAAEHVVHVAEDGVEVQHLRGQHLPAAKREQLAGECRRALAGLDDLGDVQPPRVVGLDAGLQQLAAAQDDRQQVVEVVGHAAGEPPDRLEPLRQAKLLFELLALGDVAEAADHPGGCRVASVQGHRVHLQPPAGAIRPADVQGAIADGLTRAKRELLGVFGGRQIGTVLAHRLPQCGGRVAPHLLQRPAQDLLGGGVGVENLAGAVRHQHAVGQRVVERARASLGQERLTHGQPPRHDV
jgi:hypothetical protein